MGYHKKRMKSRARARIPSEAEQYQRASQQLMSLSGFEGANASSRRGYIWWPTLDTRRELDTYSRKEMLRRSRWLRANTGLPNRICRGLSDIIGYLKPLSNSGDEAWDDLADAHWDEMTTEASVIDAAGQYDIRGLQIELNAAAFGDGDILPVLIRRGKKDGLQIALYEGHQIASPQNSGPDWFDGVQVDKFRRHLAYGLMQDNEVTVINARNALYYSHPDTPGRIRPPTILRHAINHMMDIAEILADVKLTVKVAAQIGLYLESTSGNPGGYGGSDALGSQLRDERAAEGDGTAQKPPADYKVEDLYRSLGGLMRLPDGTKIGVIQDTRPHQNTMALIQHLVRDIAWGVGVAPELLWDIADLRGANTRLVNADLERWIACKLIRLRSWLYKFRSIWIAHEIESGRLPEPAAGAKFWRAEFLPQASLTADKGREGHLDIELVINNMLTLADYYAEQGMDWFAKLKQINKERKVMAEFGLSFADLQQEQKKRAEMKKAA